MLKYLGTKGFIGDLSLEDADVLAALITSFSNGRVLEFGAGGSTQIISQCGASLIDCVETDPNWIKLTQQRLQTLANATPVNFMGYTTKLSGMYDVIFVDGVDNLRREFAINTWQNLSPNGVMLFHDTRRFQDFQNAAWIAQLYFNEIKKMDINAKASNDRSSNMTLIFKKPHEQYVNWNESEGKPSWAYGRSDQHITPLWRQHD